MKSLIVCAFKFRYFLMATSTLIMLFTTLSFFELSNASAQYTTGEVDILNNQGLIMANSGNFTEVIKYYDKALAIDPNNTDTLINKGNALGSIGNFTEAIKYYDKALAIRSK